MIASEFSDSTDRPRRNGIRPMGVFLPENTSLTVELCSPAPRSPYRPCGEVPLSRTIFFAAAAGLLVLSTLTSDVRSQDASVIRQPDLVYASPEGKDLHLDFLRPEGDGPFPLVVCIHGGGWRGGARTDYKDFQSSMAAMGVATASIQYRFAPLSKFPSQLNDVRAALQFLLADSARFHVDPQRILWMGGSAGGHLALLAGLEKNDRYTSRLIINVAGPTDLRNFKSLPSGDELLKKFSTRNSSELLEDLLGTADRSAQVYQQASPITHVRADSPRVVTCHGEKDDIVPISQAELLHEKLRELKVPEKLVRAKSGGHNLGAWEASERQTAILTVVEEIKTAISQP